MKIVDTPPTDYRLNVGMVILNAQKKLFLGKRCDVMHEENAKPWQMPQGGVDVDEPLDVAVLREATEEIGSNRLEILSESQYWYLYDLPVEISSKLWQGHYKGQVQKWFLLRFLGRDSDICLETQHAEFCAWKWSTPHEAITHVIDFKKDVYRRVLGEFGLY